VNRLASLRPRNWTFRVRLTALYGGLFFLAGAVLLGLTYLLVRESLDARGLGLVDPAALDRLPDFIKDRFDPILLAKLQDSIRADQEQFQQQTLDALLTRGAIALGLVGVVAIGFGWLVADRVLRPLHRITEIAGRVAHADGLGGLAERIALAGPRDEITRLADTFDAMLDRLDRSFDGQRRLVANASHELRTPLAINRALIELAITRPEASADTIQLGEALLEINSRHERLIDGLLTLADSENAITEHSEVDLHDVARHVLDQTELPPGLTVTADLAPAATTGDPVLLERLVHNLVENAVRHNAAPGWIEVATRTTAAGRAELVVRNTGRTVAPYEAETIFLPFRRLHAERTSPRGFGLGLSIVAAVARAHRGSASATPRAGGGLVVTVTLPARTVAPLDRWSGRP
jgi:signal transduction histidine kinase